jgi:hypothetical protein
VREGEEGAGDDGSPFGCAQLARAGFPAGSSATMDLHRRSASARPRRRTITPSPRPWCLPPPPPRCSTSSASRLGSGSATACGFYPRAYPYDDAQGCSSDAPRAIGTGAAEASQQQVRPNGTRTTMDDGARRVTDGRRMNGRCEWVVILPPSQYRLHVRGSLQYAGFRGGETRLDGVWWAPVE